MAGFATLHASEEDSRPVELYRFSLGSENFLCSSSEDAITTSLGTWEPVQGLGRGDAKFGVKERDQSFPVTMPASHEFVQRYLKRPPAERGMVTIVVVERDETPLISTLWLVAQGFVKTVGFPGTGKVAQISVVGIDVALNRQIPRRTCAAKCTHFLYGPGCEVDPDLHKFSGTVSAENGLVITLPGAGAFSSKFGTDGFIRPQGVTSDFRTIIDQSGDQLTLSWPFPDSLLGSVVDVFKGCNRLIDGDCKDEFDNVPLHGGCPWVPKRNIFRSGIK